MMSPSSMYRSDLPRPPLFCNACCGSWAPVSFSKPQSWKFALIPAFWLRGLLAIAVLLHEWLTPIQRRVPAACRAAMLPRVSAATKPKARLHSRGHQRVLALPLDLLALARALPVQHGTSFDVSTLLLPCAWE